MNFFEYYYKSVVKYDLINKFNYINTKQLPEIKKIVLYFSFKKVNINVLISALLALQLLSMKNGKVLKAKNFNTSLKIRKGQPIGCKVLLMKNHMYFFLYKLLTDIKNLEPNCTSKTATLSFTIGNLMQFTELQQNYKVFKDLLKLNISCVTTAKTFNEFIFLIKSFKINIKKLSLQM